MIPVSQGVTIDHVTLPFIDPVSLGWVQYPITVVFIVAVANIVNFADGMDGLAAGLCLISAGTFCVAGAVARPVRGRHAGGRRGGACLGFLPWNFHPAKIFMGDAGSLPLGFLLASMSITGVMKTAAALALVFPLIVLLVPILDTSFVILKRLKYKQSVTVADRNHLHHRMLRVGYSQRQAALVLYGWCLVLAAFALAVRFLHYKHRDGTIDLDRHARAVGVRAGGAVGVGVRRLRARDHQVPPPADARHRPQRRGRGRRAAGHRPAAPARGRHRLTAAVRAARCYVAKARIWRSTSHPCTSIPSPISWPSAPPSC